MLKIMYNPLVSIGQLLVSVLVFYSEDPSSDPAEVFFFEKCCCEKDRK